MRKLLLPVTTLAVAGVVATGCGESTEADTSSVPISVALEIDDSVTTQSTGLQTIYAEDAETLVQGVIARGGWIKASVFRGSAASFTLGTLKLDPSASLARRRRDSAEGVGALGSTLSQVLGLTRMEPSVRQRLATLPEGSAVADALREAIQDVAGEQGERWAVVTTDGINNTSGKKLPLGNVNRTAQILKRAVGPVDASGVKVAMIGVGLSRERFGPSRAKPLVAAWDDVCGRLGAAGCVIASEPSLPSSLAGGGS